MAQNILLSAVRSLTDLISWIGRKALGIRSLTQGGSLGGGGKNASSPDGGGVGGGLGGGSGPSLGSGGGSSQGGSSGASPGQPGGSLLDGIDEDLDWFRLQYSKDVGLNFSESKSGKGVPWAPLKWRDGRPLILTGLLMRSAIEWASRASVGIRLNQFGGAVSPVIEYSMSAPVYWKYHQYGTGRIPARPFLDPRQESIAGLQARVAKRIQANLAK